MRRGFTLLELAVAIAMSAVVILTMTTVLTIVLQQQRRVKQLSELQRDGQFVTQLLTQDLRQAGLGVPTEDHIWKVRATGNFVYGASAPNSTSFDAHRLLVAAPTQLGMLGDVAKPDANYPTFGPLHNERTGDGTQNSDTIAWHNENNGACVQNNTGFCGTDTMATASQFFPGNASKCTTGAPTNRTCPWALGRVFAGEAIQIIDGNGSWAHAHVRDPISALDDNAHGHALGLRLDTRFDYGSITGVAGDKLWKNANAGDGPAELIGQGWVTTLDRVFYVFNAATKRITRQQCFGDPDPANVNWPLDTVNAVPATPTFTAPCVGCGGSAPSPIICTPAETVARNVTTMAFIYRDAAGNPVVGPANGAAKDTIASVSWRIVFNLVNGPPPTAPVEFIAEGTVQLEN